MPIAEFAAASPGDALARYFGLDAFRPGQEAALAAVLDGRDALVILPTGGGKSLIYQLAALLLPRPVLVVSPLIALITDQYRSLVERGYPGVAALHSGLGRAEQDATLAAYRDGRVRLLYVTPERCASAEFVELSRAVRPSLIAVDEAHCISEWGHDFRISYQLLDDAARALGRPPLLALTATATPWVRDDIVERLDLADPALVVRGFDRPNLFYEAYPAADDAEKDRRLTALIAEAGAEYDDPVSLPLAEASRGSGIVYTALTASARTIAQRLNRAGVHAAYYHGQLKPSQRAAIHERFRGGAIRTIAATNAFGLGIDRADLRFVAHYHPPPSLEAYYQEAGRAGRDGGFARCPLIFLDADLGRVAFAGGSGAVPGEEIAAVLRALDGVRRPLLRAAVARRAGVSPSRALRALELLVAAGAAHEAEGRYRPVGAGDDGVARAVALEDRRRRHDRTKQEMLRTYVRTRGCRRRFLLNYFGEHDVPERCGSCDRCVPRRGESVPSPSDAGPAGESPFVAGARVEHASWGTGVVQNVEGARLTVQFEEAGYRTLDHEAVLERDLLRPIAG